jgi:hypothetical protein
MQVKFTSFPSAYSLIDSAQIDNSIPWRFWGKWLLAALAVLLIFSLTIEVAPFLHKDEFMIIDIGRIILNPDTDWSITWLVKRGEPVFLWFYVGPVVQELAFQSIGQYGPRIIALIGALAAATTMIGWLLARGTSRNAALLLGLIFLIDPIFVQAFTLGRVDGWTIALAISACWILRTTAPDYPNKNTLRKRVILYLAICCFSLTATISGTG